MSRVIAVCRDEGHGFSKVRVESIRLIAGEGVEYDAHRGVTVKHRSRVKADPTQPNLRQVHLIHHELLDDLRSRGFRLNPGDMGENITTYGVDLLALPAGTHLHLGSGAQVEITGLRNPCAQLDHFQQGLMAAVLDRDTAGNLIRKAGVMAVVVRSGYIRSDDLIEVILPKTPFRSLECV